MKLCTGWNDQTQAASGKAIRAAIMEAQRQREDAFVVLDHVGQHYLQTLHGPAGFIVEKREGSWLKHYRATNLNTANVAHAPELWAELLAVGKKRDRNFNAEEVIDVFIAYSLKLPDPPFVQWERIQV